MITYFEKNYIGSFEKGSKTLRKTPRFAIAMWNVYERVKLDLPRTNNHVESWHKQFSNEIHAHPTIPKLIEQFKTEQSRTENKIARYRSGQIDLPHKTKIEFEERLKKAVEEYDVDDIDYYLETISLVFATKD